MIIELPISKSIANRLLLLQYMHRDEPMFVSDAMPDDVLRMANALRRLNVSSHGEHIIIDCQNAGTVMRFLCAYVATQPGLDVTLDGLDRMHKRPIGAEVEALRSVGADIRYKKEEGFPPLHIKGKMLNKSTIVSLHHPLSSQFVSALLLAGWNVETDSTSPYITMTRCMIAQYPHITMEYDWSAAAFWYEYVAIHGGEIFFPGLSTDTLQGDSIVREIFTLLGVVTQPTADGILICHNDSTSATRLPQSLDINFSLCPDLYPAVYVSCLRLGVVLHADGIETLRIKESDRIAALEGISAQPDFCPQKNQHDHRIAMALLAGDYLTDDKVCVRKSYPLFVEQLAMLRQQ